jgi:hypothetical protein
VVLRGFNPYGDPRPWAIDTQGPDGASLLFLLMTLGPIIGWYASHRGVFVRPRLSTL